METYRKARNDLELALTATAVLRATVDVIALYNSVSTWRTRTWRLLKAVLCSVWNFLEFNWPILLAFGVQITFSLVMMYYFPNAIVAIDSGEYMYQPIGISPIW